LTNRTEHSRIGYNN